MTIHVGGGEALRDDSFRLARAAADAGVDVTLECWADVVHVWHMYAPVLPEANAALDRLATWLDDHWPDAGLAPSGSAPSIEKGSA